MNGLRTGETVRDGQVIPEAEVNRGGHNAAPFQVREATTVHLGPRGGRIKTQGPQAGRLRHWTPAPLQSFNVREAVTVTLPPPHWATLTQQEETTHAPQPGPDTDSGKD